MGKHLIVISFDALVYEDLEYAATLPNFARIINNGSVIEKVMTNNEIVRLKEEIENKEKQLEEDKRRLQDKIKTLG